MTARLLTSVILLAALAAGPVLSQDRDLDESIKGKESDLQKLRREIRDQRKKISEIEEQEKDVSEYIRKLENEEKLMKRLLSGLEDKETMLEQQVGQLRTDLETNEIIYSHRLEVFSSRLREIYKDGARHVWQELLELFDVALQEREGGQNDVGVRGGGEELVALGPLQDEDAEGGGELVDLRLPVGDHGGGSDHEGGLAHRLARLLVG